MYLISTTVAGLYQHWDHQVPEWSLLGYSVVQIWWYHGDDNDDDGGDDSDGGGDSPVTKKTCIVRKRHFRAIYP